MSVWVAMGWYEHASDRAIAGVADSLQIGFVVADETGDIRSPG